MVPFISMITTFKNKNEERHEFEAWDANGRAISVKERQLFMIHYQLLLGSLSQLWQQEDGRPLVAHWRERGAFAAL